MVRVYECDESVCLSERAVVVSEAEQCLTETIELADGIRADVIVNKHDVPEIEAEGEDEATLVSSILVSGLDSGTSDITVLKDCGMKEFKVKFMEAGECADVLEELVNEVDEECCSDLSSITDRENALLVVWDE